MQPVCIIEGSQPGPLVLTCEHASCAVPVEFDALGLDAEALREHVAWDIGAQPVTEALARALDAPAVLAGISRLVIDCNRDLSDHDLIVGESHGVPVPGNTGIDAAERRRRITDFYQPYHDAVDAMLKRNPGAFLLSVHSFTPSLNGRERPFDIGVLFDVFAAEAQQVGAALANDGLLVRYNEPYSGLDGLIFSARMHGMRHGLRYLELEVNNRLLRETAGITRVSAAVACAVSPCIER